MLFNGTNCGPEATAIYERWVEKNRDSGRSSGSRRRCAHRALGADHLRCDASSGRVDGDAPVSTAAEQRLSAEAERHARATVSRSLEQNSVHFNEAREKLEKQQRRQRQEIFKAEDEIMEKRDGLIDSLERRLAQWTETAGLFTIRWVVA